MLALSCLECRTIACVAIHCISGTSVHPLCTRSTVVKLDLAGTPKSLQLLRQGGLPRERPHTCNMKEARRAGGCDCTIAVAHLFKVGILPDRVLSTWRAPGASQPHQCKSVYPSVPNRHAQVGVLKAWLASSADITRALPNVTIEAVEFSLPCQHKMAVACNARKASPWCP